jgi:predicted ABC-type ATPase
MERRPEFTIIAGPNGASKSRLGIFYSNVQAFDGDRLAMTLKKEHPDWVSRWIDGTSDFGDIIAIHIPKSGKHMITDHPQIWFEKFFKDAFDKLI